MTSLFPNSHVAPVLSRRAWLGTALMLGIAQSATAAATLPIAKSLRIELAQALKGGNPLVLMVSLDGCPYCKVAREQYLGPMRDEQDLPIVQVDMQSSATLQDFKGVVLTHDELVHAWKVTLAPTILFFGPEAAEVAPRLAGFGSPDYYGTNLEQRLEQARVALRVPTPAKIPSTR